MLTKYLPIIALAISTIAVNSTVATADVIIFDAATVMAGGATGDGTFNLNVNTLNFPDFDASGVDIVVQGFDPLGTPDNLGRNDLLGNPTIGVVGGAAGVAGTEAIVVSFSEEVFISQIVLGGVGDDPSDDTVTLAGLSSSITGVNFADVNAALGTSVAISDPVFSVLGSDLILDLLADNGDGDGLDITDNAGLAINFDAPIPTTGFTFTGDIDNDDAGIGISSITFAAEAPAVPEPSSAVALIGLAGLLFSRRRRS